MSDQSKSESEVILASPDTPPQGLTERGDSGHTLAKAIDEGRWISRKPFTFTDKNLSLLDRRGGCHCVLCTKRFVAGNAARWIYCNSTPGQLTGNFFVCSNCDDGNDDSMRAKGKASLTAVSKAAKAWGIHYSQYEE
jgi:hypothetical protein